MIGHAIGLLALLSIQIASPNGEQVILPGQKVEGITRSQPDIFRLPVLPGMDLQVTVDTAGDASVTLYGTDGKQLVTSTGRGKLTLATKAREEGVYFLGVSVANVGAAYQISLAEPSVDWAAASSATFDAAIETEPSVRAEPAWMDKVTPLPLMQTQYGVVMPVPYGETITGNFAQAEKRPSFPGAPVILYSFEGRRFQRVKVEVRSSAAHTLVSVARDPAASRMDIVSSDAKYRDDVDFDSVLDGYLPADGNYYVIVRAFANGPKGQRDPGLAPPQSGEFTIRLGDDGRRSQ